MMFGIKARITKCIDDESQPSFVECQFVDASGCTQMFIDKDAIFTTEITENLDRNSKYPIEGVIGCEIIERKIIDGDREIIKVDTSSPWGIVSVEEKTIFDVFREQIAEFEHGSFDGKIKSS